MGAKKAAKQAAKGTRSSFATSAKRGIVVRSAEGTRMTGLSALASTEERQAAVAALLRAAK